MCLGIALMGAPMAARNFDPLETLWNIGARGCGLERKASASGSGFAKAILPRQVRSRQHSEPRAPSTSEVLLDRTSGGPPWATASINTLEQHERPPAHPNLCWGSVELAIEALLFQQPTRGLRRVARMGPLCVWERSGVRANGHL